MDHDNIDDEDFDGTNYEQEGEQAFKSGHATGQANLVKHSPRNADLNAVNDNNQHSATHTEQQLLGKGLVTGGAASLFGGLMALRPKTAGEPQKEASGIMKALAKNFAKKMMDPKKTQDADK